MTDRFNLGPPPRLAYSASVIDRAAHLRAAKAAALRGRRNGLRHRRRTGRAAKDRERDRSGVLARAARANSRRASEEVFLGLHDGRPVYGVVARRRPAIDALKSACRSSRHRPALDRGAGAGRARNICRRSRKRKALLGWHARHRFCSNCGAPTECRRRPAGGAIARSARRSIFRAPTRS